MNITMEGKVIIVTGAATGMGKETALLFGREGAKVAVVTARNIAGAQAVADEIVAKGGDAFALQCDVSKEAEVERMVALTVEKYGRLDFAFNNAGIGPDAIINGDRVPAQAVADQEEKYWDLMIDTNLKGTYFCMKYEIRQMQKQGTGGSIVNTASIGAIKFVPTMGAYAASKAGLIGLSKTAALEVGPDQIRVNVLCPGPTTGTVLQDNLCSAVEGHFERVSSGIPLRRMGTAKEIAQNVFFLCTDAAAYITGQAICLDGGNTAGAARRGGVG